MGYTVSFACALMSLWRIVATFKEFTKRSQYERNMQLLRLRQRGVPSDREEAAAEERGPARAAHGEGMQMPGGRSGTQQHAALTCLCRNDSHGPSRSADNFGTEENLLTYLKLKFSSSLNCWVLRHLSAYQACLPKKFRV